MIVTFDREPFGWVHPLYRRRCHNTLGNLLCDFDSFVGPALNTVNSLSHILQMTQQEPRVIQSLVRQKETQQLDKFEVKVNVQQFAPEELDVKMVDNFVVIEGKHEEKKDEQGYISRHFTRRYQLPEDVKPEMVTCNLGSDGILCVTAPRMTEQKQSTERSVPINFTAQPAVTEDKEGDQTVETNSS